MTIKIPQILIKDIIEEIITIVANQHSSKVAATLESESWLYRTFNGVTAGTFDYYQQAVELFVTRDKNSPRRFEVRREFDRDRASLPTVFINTPSETQDGVNAVGLNWDVDSTYYTNDDDTVNESYGRAYKGVYELMCTSSNKDEAELIYRFLEAIFIAFGDTWSANFNDTFMFSGKQLVPNPELIPTPMMIRVWTITIGDVQEIPIFGDFTYQDATDIQFDGTIEEE